MSLHQWSRLDAAAPNPSYSWDPTQTNPSLSYISFSSYPVLSLHFLFQHSPGEMKISRVRKPGGGRGGARAAGSSSFWWRFDFDEERLAVVVTAANGGGNGQAAEGAGAGAGAVVLP